MHADCIYIARVSAFSHVLTKEHGDSAVAQARMNNIWRFGGVWAVFIDNLKAIGSEHLYASEDYDV